MARQIVLDTETTGLEPEEGHRIIEIGCVEVLNRRLTGSRFHVYLNPDREIDQGAVEVHGLDNAFLADKPHFEDVVGDFLNFVDGAELIIHNAPFDTGFINAELKRQGHPKSLADHCAVLDTLAMARKKHPGQRNSLDALCKRYNVNNAHRELHGALLDAEILAEVYLAMTGGQSALMLEEDAVGSSVDAAATPALFASGPRPALRVIRCGDEDLQAHEKRLDAVAKSSGGRCVWRQAEGGQG
ncbi:DNA polymerase III subunit epsilon [Methylococcus sp. EFPC2]|uniref:DNA polymerase III subunit epsilon n=1 Tax=Methylococcus sp. EFPC2 TaxID=2812648 RepID=UPI001968A12D|nr:DNA polymerase III subunit epsilon [Methylococcus sp. EFPC2]QSA96090.1 DNA polymerase III subunit epsilon [Methylococcus sp. EFPC2]